MTFSFWVKYLKFVSFLFIGMGFMWALVGSFDPLGIYDGYMAQTFWEKETLPEEAARTMQFILGPFGMTSAGHFILQYFIAVHAFAKKEKWAYDAISIAFGVWFLFDSLLCWGQGAYFNILMANVPSLIMMLPVLVATRKYFDN